MEEPIRRDTERGMALVLSLVIMLAMSVLAASMMLLSQTETYSSMNFRLMSQARYGAESGVHKVVNYLLNTYTPPGGATDPLASYDMTKSPVLYGGQPVILSGNSAVASNYPVNAVQTAFSAAAQGTLAAGNGSVQYVAYATLLSMQVAGGQTVMSWQITSDGTIGGARPAVVEVTSVLEKQLTPQLNAVYAAFALAPVCAALTINSATVDSYDSTAALGGNGKPVIANNNGNLGTNGNLNENNSSQVYGTLSTPRVGVGSCSAGNVTAESISGGATISGGIIHLSQAVTAPTPPTPNPAPNPSQNISVTDVSNCPSGLTAPASCTKTGSYKTFTPGTYGNFNLTNTAKMHFSAGVYNVNSLTIDNASTLILDSSPVIINVVGKNADGTNQSQPFWLNSSIVTDPTKPYDPTQFTVNYGGPGTVRFDNAAMTLGQVNAPNANVNINSSDFYGTVIGYTVTMGNAGKLHFDRHLGVSGPPTFIVGNDMLTSFTWKKF